MPARPTLFLSGFSSAGGRSIPAARMVCTVPPGRQVVVRATTEVAEGQYNILGSDAAGNDKRVTVTVSKSGRADAPSNGAG